MEQSFLAGVVPKDRAGSPDQGVLRWATGIRRRIGALPPAGTGPVNHVDRDSPQGIEFLPEVVDVSRACRKPIPKPGQSALLDPGSRDDSAGLSIHERVMIALNDARDGVPGRRCRLEADD